ncbi:hypothetical protein WA158_000117 [Blastocystis sp. Blastoise]
MLSRSIQGLRVLRTVMTLSKPISMNVRYMSSGKFNKETKEDIIINNDDPLNLETDSESVPIEDIAPSIHGLAKDVVSVDVNDIEKIEHPKTNEDISTNTITAWFDFMDIHERPYGNWRTFEPDQIMSSLEFDLYGKNCQEIYKYEKDDLHVDFDLLKRVKYPEMLEVPQVKDENGQNYLNDVCFELNRNANYTFKEKQRLVNYIKKIIEDESYIKRD